MTKKEALDMADELSRQIMIQQEYLAWARKVQDPDIDIPKIISYTENTLDDLERKRNWYIEWSKHE
jgi:hypothetical protein